MKVLSFLLKFILIALISVILLVLLCLAGLNIAKFFIYSDYYAIEEDLCNNPGLNDGFVCQGVAISEENERVLVCGYMADKSNSRIYVTDLDNNSYHVKLTKNGKAFTGHAGGIATSENNVYIANNKKIYTVLLSDILACSDGDFIDIGDGIDVNNSASFVFANEEYVYVGEFHDGNNYITNHPYETASGTNYAIISRYPIDDLSTPDKIYSVRNKVQGVCFTPDGKIVLSTSYGVADTIYYVYNEDEATLSDNTFCGAPVYYLEKCVKEIHGPAMGEDMEYYDGKIITLTESASNKYIFGKFFFATKIVSLEF